MNEFDIDKYYYNFLDIEKAKKVNDIFYIKTSNRDNILNKAFEYPLIISNYNNEIYVSISDKYYDGFLNYIKDIDMKNITEQELYKKIKNYFSNILDTFEIKTMYRMYRTTKIYRNFSKAILLNEITKKYFMNTGEKAKDNNYKENKWQSMKYLTDQQMVYIISNDEKIDSIAYISDVFNGGANIVVNTDEKYRNQGYGKSVVTEVCNYAIDNDLIPIYFVNKENKASVKLAESLCFKIIATEVVLCITGNNMTLKRNNKEKN